jgi:hypothetical protein
MPKNFKLKLEMDKRDELMTKLKTKHLIDIQACNSGKVSIVETLQGSHSLGWARDIVHISRIGETVRWHFLGKKN